MSVFNVLLAFRASATEPHSLELSKYEQVMQKMVAASDYWQPEHTQIHKADNSAAGSAALISHLLFTNTPQSKSETVHVSACGGYMCAANVRLDNRAELCAELNIDLSGLDNEGIVADGAIILAAYQAWGEGCAAKLLGDFAFSVLDVKNNSLYIARDHIGIKTVFYSVTENTALVSNEHNALLSSGLVSRELNDDYVIDEFLPRENSGYNSPIKAITCVPPAHYAVITDNGVRSACYWQLEVKKYPELHSDDDYLRELRAQFERAVKRRLVTENPIGAELSEGLDSTAIAGLTAKMLPEQTIYTYSYDSQLLTDENRDIYQDTYKDIFDFLALHPNLQAEWTTQRQPANYDTFVEQCYGVMAPNSGQTSTRYYLMKEKGVRTLLSGWGGDHCVTSYGVFYEDELFRKGHWFALSKQFRDMRARGRNVNPLFSFFKLCVKYGCPPVFRAVERRRHAILRLLYFSATEAPLRSEILSEQRLGEAIAFANNYVSRGVRERDYRELFQVGVERRVTGSEIHARAFNFEYRYPMLDKELVEFAYSVPNHLKCKFGVERWMFREIIKDLVTERIRMRLKHDVDLPKHERPDIKENTARVIAEIKDNSDQPVFKRYLDFEQLENLLRVPYVGNLKGLLTLCRLSEAEQEGRIVVGKEEEKTS